MITQMKKYVFLVYHREYDAFLDVLQQQGVLHVQVRQDGAVGENTDLSRMMEQADKLTSLRNQLESLWDEKQPMLKANESDAQWLIDAYDAILQQHQVLKTKQQHVQQQINQVAPWGLIDWDTIENLEKSGYAVAFYSAAHVPEEQIKEYNLFEVAKVGANTLYVAFNPQGNYLHVSAEAIDLPRVSLDELNNEYDTLETEIQQVEQMKQIFAAEHLAEVNHALAHLQDDIRFENVKLNSVPEANQHLYVLEGFCPVENSEALDAVLNEQGVWYESRMATLNDNAPVKLKNNPIVKMYEAITRMYGLPSATDTDPTVFLSIFFTLFFAICIADAGYGILLTLLSLADIKSGGKIGKVLFGINFKLVLVLGIACIFVGTVFGTFCGVDLSAQSFVPEWLKSCMIVGKFPGTNYDKQMVLSLLIGVVHISLAMTVKAINTTCIQGFKNCLSTWGWWLAIVGSSVTGALAWMGVIPSANLMPVLGVIGGISAIGIYLLNDLHRNPIINILAGLYDTYNMASGLMGDILSYIRLYALGLAGGMLGATFNNLAMMTVDNDPLHGGFALIGFVLIIVVGHILNIAMSCLSAFVHPLRLSFVEYFKNAGYEGKGIAYNPFKLTEK